MERYGKEARVSSNWPVLPRHQWCGQDHAINCARAALRNSDASVQEVDCLLGLLSSELLTPGTNVSKQEAFLLNKIATRLQCTYIYIYMNSLLP